jgi:3,4-dihydroxy-2-butanone 4-phosphate synthase
MVSLEIGSSNDCFHYCSEQFMVNQSKGEYCFMIAPRLVQGCYFKLKLIGKKTKQSHDSKFYVALNYFGIEASSGYFESIDSVVPKL